MHVRALLTAVSLVGVPVAQRATPPPSFVANAGQWAPATSFAARVPGALVSFGDGGVVTRLRTGSITTRFVGAQPAVHPRGEEPTAHRANFYLGNDPRLWRSGVPTFAALRYAELWPGIDLRYSGSGSQLEYVCFLAPRADVATILFRCPEATGLALGSRGELHVTTPLGAIVEAVPRAWQDTEHGRIAVGVRFEIRGERDFGFALDGGFDPDLEVVIDPVLGYSTFLGGANSDEVHDLAVDASGAAYVVGGTRSPDFPATGTPLPGSEYVAFVSKLAPDGASLVYSTFLGGSSHQIAYGLALRGSEAVVVGLTTSVDFPTTVGAFDRTFRSTAPHLGDAFATVLTASGALGYSTYVGGPGAETAFAVSVDVTGAFTFVGTSGAGGYPTTAGAFQPGFGGVQDVVVTRIAPDGLGASDLRYSTYLGGSDHDEAHAIALTGQLEFFVAGATRSVDFPASSGSAAGGFDAFVARLRPLGAGSADRVWARRFGGTSQDYALGVCELAGDAAAVGVTYSTDFPTTAGVFQRLARGGGQDGFVARLAGDGSALTWSSHLGGSRSDRAVDVEALATGNVVVLGHSASTDFPITAAALDATHNGNEDLTISVVAGNGAALTWSSYFGGTGLDSAEAVAVGADGTWTFCGNVTSADYPVSAGAFDTTWNGPAIDAVITRIAHRPPSVWGSDTLTSLGRAPILFWDGSTLGPSLGDASGRVVAARLVPGSLAVMVVGAPRATPLVLAPFGGVPGSVLLLDALTLVALTAGPSGDARLALPIPMQPELVDGEVSFQVFDLDPGLPFPLPLAHSRALTLRVWP